MLKKVVSSMKNRMVQGWYEFNLVENVKKDSFLRGLDINVLRQLYRQPRIFRRNVKWPRNVTQSCL